MTISDKDLKLVKQGAMSAFRSGRGIFSADDLIGEAHLWLVENIERVFAWGDEGKHGENKIRHAAKQHCLQKIAIERKKRSGLQRGDSQYYNAAILKEILPDIFNRLDWAGGSPAPTDQIRAASAPAEGNNRLAMIVDVKAAFVTLPPQDKTLLYEIYFEGMSLTTLQMQYEVTDRTIRRREARALERLVERLGGEPPWY